MPRVRVALPQHWAVEIGDWVTALAWSPDGRLVAAAAADGPVAILDGETGLLKHRLRGHGLGTLALAWAPGGRHLATGGQDGMARIWSVETGAQTAELPGGSAWVEHVAWNAKSDLIATGSGRFVKVWRPDGSAAFSLDPLPATVGALQWKPGGQGLAVASYGGIWLWPDGPGSAGMRLDWKGSLLSLQWSPDGKWLASGSQEGTIQTWNVRTGKDLAMYGYPVKVRELAWDPGSRYLATGGSAEVVVWDWSGKGPEGSKPLLLKGHSDLITDLAFASRGLLASGGQDGAVLLWQPGRSASQLGGAVGSSAIAKLAWQPGGALLAAGDSAGVVRVWKAE